MLNGKRIRTSDRAHLADAVVTIGFSKSREALEASFDRYKRISIDDGRGGEPMVYREQVARFSLGDFERLLTPHGLEIVGLYGDYRLNPYDDRTSPRLILIARQVLADTADGLRRHAEIGREHPLRNALRQ